MQNEEKKKLMMQALQNLQDRKLDQRQSQKIGLSNPDLSSQNLAKGALDKDVLKVKGGDVGRDVTEGRTRISGGVPKIDTASIQKQTPIDDFTSMQYDIKKNRLIKDFKKAADAGDKSAMEALKDAAMKLKMGARTGLKALPIIGGAASLLMNPEDASAAIPGLDSSESVGMSAADENQMIAERQAQVDYGQSPAAKDKLRMELLAKLAGNRK